MISWNGRKVLIIGAARQGIALARYLCRHGAQVTLTDQKTADQLQNALHALADCAVQWALGGHPLDLLDACDLLCPSGGVPLDLPLIVEAQRRGIPLSNDSQIFLEAAPCRVIGITGSAGKTTTTTLVGRMAQAAARMRSGQAEGSDSWASDVRLPASVYVGGNIGIPLISAVDEMTADDLAVMEISSFQLDQMTRSPHIAAITNITPNHLDRHGTMAAYIAAKARILDFQSSADAAVLGHEDSGAWGLKGQVKGRLISFGIRPFATAAAFAPSQAGVYLRGELLCWLDDQGETPLFSRQCIQLRGEHNLLNVLAACAIAAAAGLPPQAMQAGVEGFSGVAHRLELVRHWRGADWYNDSIATTPERVLAAMRSFDEPDGRQRPLVLLIGGRDKHLPWNEFADLARQRVDHLILFGEMAELVEQALHQAEKERGDSRPRYTLQRVARLQDAVQAAAEIVTAGDVVLLSPGGTSFDEFRDFEARGEAYRKWVNELS